MLDNQNHLNFSPMDATKTLESPQRCSIQSLLQPFWQNTPTFPLGQKVAAEGYEWLYVSHIDQVSEHWQNGPNLFLQSRYLQALEDAHTEGLEFRYLLAFKNGKAVGGINLQLLTVSAAHSIRSLRQRELIGFWDRIKLLLANWGTYRFMIWGNMFLTGQYNQWWDIAEKDLPALQTATLKVLNCLARQEKIQILMARDSFHHEEVLENAGFHAIDFQPNMCMELPDAWKNSDDYLNAMSSKYRVRARRAFKKSEGIIFRELDLRQIELFSEDLYALHLSVVNQADFNMLWVGKDYFVQLKQQLGADFCLTACFEKERLLGFFTTIRNGKELDANFLGFDPEANREHQLYLSMLYKMVEQALQFRCNKICFARTALEIKSSVGAIAQKTFIYLKHTNPILNHILPTAVRFGEPKEHWTPRHPFREE
ncbi:hypothetical protein [Haliscomenobacter hydrossis]|uniref:BioF2-like acetyltransferase domain-containing protein n=1 Tax=Haliscomenobacter hydrossis (strain ATCC 27775 / DSM 1100 / LMG 10767 / O) TaxID=760192 RepID=F4KY31_HALH1|nr:hypothetical protein [Haliscomenobacter hydrossis]AEE53656.1 hypothetical protein Halhy_5833 [Haliscomenobacter hydrossis DSM 1100]